MKVLDNREVIDYIRMCDDAYYAGWHESNGGNASHRLTDKTVDAIKEDFDRREHVKLNVDILDLKGEYFLITGGSRCLKNVIRYPEENIAIIEVDENGSGYYIRWGLILGGKPTMETSTHLLTHNLKKAEGKRTLLHSHPIHVNALTFLLDQDSKLYTRILWSVITECSIVFPKGVRIIDWMPCGDDNIAYATLKEMEESDIVIWPHHGIFAIGDTADLAFGLIQTIEKAAQIYLIAKSAGEIKQAIGKEEVERLSELFDFDFDRSIYES